MNLIKNYLHIKNNIDLGIGDWGLGPIPNSHYPIKYLFIKLNYFI